MGDLYSDIHDKNYKITGRLSSETQRAIEEGAERIDFCFGDVAIKELVRLLINGYKIKTNGEKIYFIK